MNDSLALSGKLNFVCLADLFQLLGGNKSTGILKVTSQYAPNPAQIYFANGNPINATCDSQSGIEALYSLFGWLDGSFEFHKKEVHVKQLINQGRMEIVLDALRMLDDGDIKKLGPPVAEDVKKDTLPVIKGPIADYSYILSEDKYNDGKLIVQENKYGKWIWIVLEGTADVVKETDNGPMVISQLGAGSFIGTFTTLLFGEYPRKSTVTARGQVILGLLDTERLSTEFNTLSPEFRTILLSLNNRLAKITDTATALFAKKALKLPKGTKTILEKGSSKKELFMITEGTAYLVDHTQKNNLPLMTLETEDVFGHLPLQDIGHEPRSASVLASDDLKVEKIDTESLHKEYDQLSNMFRSFIYHICTCISMTTRLVRSGYSSAGKK